LSEQLQNIIENCRNGGKINTRISDDIH
jgi:hypothetical protein